MKKVFNALKNKQSIIKQKWYDKWPNSLCRKIQNGYRSMKNLQQHAKITQDSPVTSRRIQFCLSSNSIGILNNEDYSSLGRYSTE